MLKSVNFPGEVSSQGRHFREWWNQLLSLYCSNNQGHQLVTRPGTDRVSSGVTGSRRRCDTEWLLPSGGQNSFRLPVTFTICTYVAVIYTASPRAVITYPRVIQKQHVWSAFYVRERHHVLTSLKSKHMKRPQEQVQGEASTSFFAEVL